MDETPVDEIPSYQRIRDELRRVAHVDADVVPIHKAVDLVASLCRPTSCDEGVMDWFVGPYGWVLAEPVPIPLVPVKGRLGIWSFKP